MFERLGTMPEENGAGRLVDEHQRSTAAKGLDAATYLQQVGFLFFLAAHNVQSPSLIRLVRFAFNAFPIMNGHSSWKVGEENGHSR
jgi:hypothetical protein